MAREVFSKALMHEEAIRSSYTQQQYAGGGEIIDGIVHSHVLTTSNAS